MPGSNNDLTLGGGGQDGILRVEDKNGKPVITLDGVATAIRVLDVNGNPGGTVHAGIVNASSILVHQGGMTSVFLRIIPSIEVGWASKTGGTLSVWSTNGKPAITLDGVAGTITSRATGTPAGHFESNTGRGIEASSNAAEGVLATSNSADAVMAVSHSKFAGVSARNEGGGPAVWAIGSPAGQFVGDVTVTGNITAQDVVLANSDCAEDFDVANLLDFEPGTVVVIDQNGALRQSNSAYDRKVAGVISGAGDFKPGIVLGKKASTSKRKPLALVGKVYCNVDADYFPIEVGDLLTTSDTPGHAMKAIEPLRAFGAVIGKALSRLDEGQGLLPILVSLQ
jgi:hypothetical protein